MATVLLVDDEAAVRFTLQEILEEEGHEVLAVAGGAQALERLDEAEVVVTDLAMPGMDGLTLLKRIHVAAPMLPVIMLTARGSERVAVEALKAGAHDYLTKPFDLDEVVLAVQRAAETYRLRSRNQRLEAERALGQPFIGESPAMRRLLGAVSRVASRDVTVLLRGETGTGKEMIGALLHAQSRRAERPMIRFNCAAIPPELAEAELFGHARGAFTGAHSAREGFFQRASGGTLLLDEVGELPSSIQAKLLRALQEGEIQPVGAGRVEHVDVRVIACTHRDLREDVQRGRFRADLYYRLAVVELRVPPLRDRREDIPALVRCFLRRYTERFGVEGVTLSPALVDALCAEPWEGNVRELENAVARLIALCDDHCELSVEALQGPGGAPPSVTPSADASYREQLEAFERSLLLRALDAEDGNQSAAARRLKLSRSTLIDKLKRHGLV